MPKENSKFHERLRQTNLIDYCESKGYQLESEGRGFYRVKGNSGLIVKEYGYQHYGSDTKGNAIDFCVNILDMPFREAVAELLEFQKSGYVSKIYQSSQRLDCGAGKKKSDMWSSNLFMLPSKSISSRQASKYLTQNRKLKSLLISELKSRKLIYQDDNRNCVFPCYDKYKIPKGAIVRGTNMEKPFKKREKNSDVAYGWLVTPKRDSDTVIITESPIDSISIMDLYPNSKGHYHLSLGGVHDEAVRKFIIEHPSVNKLVLAFDNDEAGRYAVARIKKEHETGKVIKTFLPKRGKDWNEHLILTKTK